MIPTNTFNNVKALCDIGYSLSTISKYTNTTLQELTEILSGNNTQDYSSINIFLQQNISTVSLKELEYKQEKYLINTPDGWQHTGKYFNKGSLPCYNITLDNGYSITCSEKHMLQHSNGTWYYAKDLNITDWLLTDDNEHKIVKIKNIGEKTCVDIEVLHQNHRYYCQGISSHNSGKSYIVASLASNALLENKYDRVFYFDSEGGALKAFFSAKGVDTTKVEQILVSSVEDATVKVLSTYAIIETYKKTHPDAKFLCILDSLGALVADKLINDAVNKGRQAGDMGLTAKAKNSLMKAVLMPALKTNTSFVVVNHVYDDPSSMFPSKVKSQSGGQGLKYAAHLIIQCHKRFEKNENKKEEGNEYRATVLRFFVTKNRIVKPFFETEMILDYNSGPLKWYSIFDPAIKYELVQQHGAFYTVPSYSEDKKYRKKELLKNSDLWHAILPEFNRLNALALSYKSGDDIGSDDDVMDAMLDDDSE